VVAINVDAAEKIGVRPSDRRYRRYENQRERECSRGKRRNAMRNHRRQVRWERLLALNITTRPVYRTIPSGFCLECEQHRKQAQTQSQRVVSRMRGSKESHRHSQFITVFLECSHLNERNIAKSLTDNGKGATWTNSRLVGQVALGSTSANSTLHFIECDLRGSEQICNGNRRSLGAMRGHRSTTGIYGGSLLMRTKRDANSKVVRMALRQDVKKEEVA
jgi:hypothetical protein